METQNTCLLFINHPHFIHSLFSFYELAMIFPHGIVCYSEAVNFFETVQ